MSWVKRLLIALGVIAAIVAVGVAALVLLINPNDYKSTLEDAVRHRYDRTLAIDGDIRLSIFPRLALEINGVSLSEPNSTQVFAAVDTAKVAVAWWPLLSRHLVIEHLSVGGVKANVVRGADGRFNFHDLLQAPAEDGAPAVTPPPAEDDRQPSIQLNVAGVSVSGGDIAVRDEGNDMAIRMERLTLSASGIAFDQPFDFSLSARVLGQSPRADATVQAQGAMRFDPYGEVYAVRDLDLRVAGVLPSVKANTFTARGNASFDARAQAVDVTQLALVFQGDVALATPLTGVEAQIGAPRLSANLASGQLQLEKVVLKALGRIGEVPFTLGLDAPALQVTDETASGGPVQAAFTLDGPRPVSARLSVSELVGNAQRLQAATLDVQANLKQGERATAFTAVSPLAASLKDRTLELPELKANVRMADPALPGGKLEIPITGKLAADFAAQTAAAAVHATLEGGALDAEVDVAGFAQPALRFPPWVHG